MTSSPGSRSSSVHSANPAWILRSTSVSLNALNFSTLPPPSLALQVSGGLHLIQPADGALEFRARRREARAFGEKRLRLRLGRHDKLHPVIVEHIHQPREAPRGIRIRGRHPRHPAEDHRVEALREVHVVRIGPGPLAQGLEVEPYEPSRALAVGN